MFHSLTLMVIGKETDKFANLYLKFNYDDWKWYLCLFVSISSHFPSLFSSLINHGPYQGNKNGTWKDIFQPDITSQTACAVFTNLVMLKFVPWKQNVFLFMKLSHCPRSHTKSTILFWVFLFVTSLLTFIFPSAHTVR